MGWLRASLRRWWRQLRQPLSLGRQGERAAARYLQRLGYKIVARGDRNRRGELDLVAVDGRTVVFVEVKTRRQRDVPSQTSDGGQVDRPPPEPDDSPAQRVDAAKQRKLTQLALMYLRRHDLLECASRFDVVAVTWPERGSPLIEHFPGAFEPQRSPGLFS